MKSMFASLAVVLGGIGLAACLAGVVVIWMARPSVLDASAEVLDAAEGSLKLVEEKATRAHELLGAIREPVGRITSKILTLADKTDRTAEDDNELQRVEQALTERLRQVDTIAEIAESAVAFLNKTSRLTKSLRLPASRDAAGRSAAADAEERSAALTKLAQRLRTLRENLAKFRQDRQAHKELTKTVVRLARDVDHELEALDSKLQQVREAAVAWRTEIAEWRPTVAAWTNWAAVIGSAILAWMGLGQYALLRWARQTMRQDRTMSPTA